MTREQSHCYNKKREQRRFLVGIASLGDAFLRFCGRCRTPRRCAVGCAAGRRDKKAGRMCLPQAIQVRQMAVKERKIMEQLTKKDVLRLVEEDDVEFIRLQFTDMFGILKNIAVTARELPKALNNECIIDGSFIDGMEGEEVTDMYLHPDPSTFAILPWRPQQGKVARLLCDIYRPDQTPYPISSRYVLERVYQEAKEMGYDILVDPECEFFLFHTDDDGMPTTVTHERAGYLDLSPVDLGENARRDIVLALEDMGFDITSSHHEIAPAQHEIDFDYAPADRMADQIMTFKMAVRTIARRHGLHATFMPKPLVNVNGSGMHLNLAVYKNGKNILQKEEDTLGLSREGYYFMGGLLAHSKEMAAVTNPLVNSYKRLVPGFEAPTEVTWSQGDKSSLIRLPMGRGKDTKIELRSPDAAANPYLVFAACIAAGLHGIKNKIDPECFYKKKAAEEGKTFELLPRTLKEAIDLMEQSQWMRRLLGDQFFDQYLAAKKKEWETYSRQVSNWELEEYLYRF